MADGIDGMSSDTPLGLGTHKVAQPQGRPHTHDTVTHIILTSGVMICRKQVKMIPKRELQFIYAPEM